MSKVGIPGFDEAMNEVPQILSGADTGPAQAFAAQDRKPDLYLIEPRAMGGQPVERDLGTLGGTPVQHGLFLMIAGIIHNQMPATVGVAHTQGVQEVAKLQVGMALIALGKDFPGANIKGGKEIEGAMADILKLLAFDQAGPQGQRRVQALQGLDVGLLIETENPTVPGRMQVEVKNLGHLLLEQRVGTGQEVAQAMGLEHQGGQNPLHRRRTHGQNLAAPGDQAGQIAHAVVRKAPKLALLNALAGDGDDRVSGQRGKNPGDDPTGANRGVPLSAPRDRLRPRLPAAAAHTEQSVCATSAPNSVTCPPRPQLPDWTIPHAPAKEYSRAAPFVAAFCPPAAALRGPAVRLDLTEFHSEGPTYTPLAWRLAPYYTANELARHGT